MRNDAFTVSRGEPTYSDYCARVCRKKKKYDISRTHKIQPGKYDNQEKLEVAQYNLLYVRSDGVRQTDFSFPSNNSTVPTDCAQCTLHLLILQLLVNFLRLPSNYYECTRVSVFFSFYYYMFLFILQNVYCTFSCIFFKSLYALYTFTTHIRNTISRSKRAKQLNKT